MFNVFDYLIDVITVMACRSIFCRNFGQMNFIYILISSYFYLKKKTTRFQHIFVFNFIIKEHSSDHKNVTNIP